MKRYAVIGKPLTHSLSPGLHNFVFQQLGIDAKYTAIQITEEELPEIIKQLRNEQLNGVNVTLPLKQAVLPFLDRIDEQAAAIGAVNCINVDMGKLIGYNTDQIGFIKALKKAKININDKTGIIVGAGGVAKSTANALMSRNIKELFIINRSAERAGELRKQLKNYFLSIGIKVTKWDKIDKQVLERALIVNCTPVGMVPNVDYSPIDEKYIFPSQTIIDTIYLPFQTKLCQIGEAVGAKTQSGLPMFIYQALSSIDIWFNELHSANIQIDKLQNYLKNITRNNR